MKEVAVGILSQDGRVLACQRKSSARYPLKWEFPGGKLEPGETPAEALARELREELSVEPAAVDLFHAQEWTYPESKSPGHADGTFRVYYFLVGSFRGRPVNAVFEDIRWVTPPELLTMDILEGNREAIQLLVKHAEKRSTPGATG